MSKEDFPEKLTKSNIPQLIEKAKRIRENSEKFRYGFLIFVLVGIPYVFVASGTFFLTFWLAQQHYLDFLLEAFSPENTIILVFVVFATLVMVFGVATLFVLNISVMWFLRNYLGFPTLEEDIFADCFIIAMHLTKNERIEAIQEVKHLLVNLNEFVRKMLNPFNPKRKVYTREFNLLRSGKTEISRMLMFSKENISELFMKFGLAFIQSDDPEAFSILQQIIGKVRECGELKGRFHRFMSGIERYPHASPLILTIIIVVIAILYYYLSGQQLPI